jgi:hypothetical protein
VEDQGFIAHARQDVPRLGSEVEIADSRSLAESVQTWRLHNPLRQEQLRHAGKVVRVLRVGFYCRRRAA